MCKIVIGIIVFIVMCLKPVDASENGLLASTMISSLNLDGLEYDYKDRICIEYYQNTYKDNNDQKKEYYNATLKYIGYQFRFGNELTDDEIVKIEFLLDCDYSDGARADLLRTYFHLWESGKNLYGFGLLAEITNKYSARDFEGCFGEFMILYQRVYMAKQSGEGAGDWKDEIIESFVEKYREAVESSKLFEIKDGDLISNIPLGEIFVKVGDLPSGSVIVK